MSTTLLHEGMEAMDLINLLAVHEAALALDLLPLPGEVAASVAACGLPALVDCTCSAQAGTVSSGTRARFHVLAPASLARLLSVHIARVTITRAQQSAARNS